MPTKKEKEQNERMAVAEVNIKNLEKAVSRVFSRIEKLLEEFANIVSDKLKYHEQSDNTFRNEIQIFKKKTELRCEECPKRFQKIENWQLKAKTWISVLVTLGVVFGSITKWILSEIIKLFT